MGTLASVGLWILQFAIQKLVRIWPTDQHTYTKSSGRHLVDIIGDISWTKRVTSRGHFWRHLMDIFVHEMSSFWVTFRGHFLGDISWTFFG